MAVERTLVLCKPDAVERGLVGEVVGRLERKGFRLVAMELRTLDEATAKQHYGEGPDAVGAVRTLMGPTNPITAPPGSIRGDYGLEIEKNLVHGSDSPESAARELGLFFPQL